MAERVYVIAQIDEDPNKQPACEERSADSSDYDELGYPIRRRRAVTLKCTTAHEAWEEYWTRHYRDRIFW